MQSSSTVQQNGEHEALSDSERLRWLIWDWQKVTQPWREENRDYQGLSLNKLRIELGWTRNRFNHIIKELLADKKSGVIRVSETEVSFTW